MHLHDSFAMVLETNEQLLLGHLNTLLPLIKFTVERQTGELLPFLDVLVKRTSGRLTHRVQSLQSKTAVH